MGKRLALITIGYQRVALPVEAIKFFESAICVDNWTSRDYKRSEWVRAPKDKIEFQFIDEAEILDAAPDDPIAPAPLVAPAPASPSAPALVVLATDKQGAVTVPDLREFVDGYRDEQVF